MSAASARSPTLTEKGPMLRMPCPWCGERDETEFHYRGDASTVRPAADEGLAAFTSYVYERDNRCGWHLECWFAAAASRKLLKVVRHTLSHEIHSVGGPEDALSLPQGL